MAEIDLPPQIRAIVDELLLRKASSRELGFAAVPRPILDFIDNEFLLAQDAFGGGRIHAPPEAYGDVETFFKKRCSASPKVLGLDDRDPGSASNARPGC